MPHFIIIQMGAAQAAQAETDPQFKIQNRPNLQKGLWLAYSRNWSNDKGPTRIHFTAVGGKPRFVIGEEDVDLEVGHLSGKWEFVANDDENKIRLTFDQDQDAAKEFDWVDSFDWNESQEPASRIKAKDNDGFFFWCVRDDESRTDSELGEPRIRADEFHPKISVTGTEDRINEVDSDMSKRDNNLVHLNSMPPAINLDRQTELKNEFAHQLSMKEGLIPLNSLDHQNYEEELTYEPNENLQSASAQKLLMSKKGVFQKPNKRQYYVKPYQTYKSRRSESFGQVSKAEAKNDQFEHPNTNGLNTSIDQAPLISNQTELSSNRSKKNTIFRDFQSTFDNLTLNKTFNTGDTSLTWLMINKQNTRIIAVLKDEGQVKNFGRSVYQINQYDMKTNSLVFKESYGGEDATYIKMKEIAQNDAGDKFACPYLNDGNFRLRVFGEKPRSQQEMIKSDVDLSRELKLNNHARANEDFADPFVTSCFINNQQLFISLFHNGNMSHYQFIWDIPSKKVLQLVTKSMDQLCSQRNFPIRSFYVEKRQMVYTFYRQGQAFSTPIKQDKKESKTSVTKKPKKDHSFTAFVGQELGQMELFKGEILISQNSSTISFFKTRLTQEKTIEWHLYHTINCRGFVSWLPGNDSIKIISEELIQFYQIDEKTMLPELQNAMKNFFQCTMMLITPDDKYCVTYRQNQNEFSITRRKTKHKMSYCLDKRSFDQSLCLELETIGVIIVSQGNRLLILDQETFEQLDTLQIDINETQTREQEKIIGMRKSEDESTIAIITGRTLVTSECKLSYLFVLKRQSDNRFKIVNKIETKQLEPLLDEANMTYMFQQGHNDVLIMSREDCIFAVDLKGSRAKLIYQFLNPLEMQPNTFVSNYDQSIFIICSKESAIYFNRKTNEEIQLNDLFSATDFKSAVYDIEERMFYLCCNRQFDQIGFYLMKFHEKNPFRVKNISQWRHKLEIADVMLHILRAKDEKTQQNYKELVIGYKTIYFNTYTIHVQDISGPCGNRFVLFRHESYHMWDNSITGVCLNRNKIYVNLSEAGLNLAYLGSNPTVQITNSSRENCIIHSLNKYNYLKLDHQNNLVNFAFSEDENKTIQIYNEWSTKDQTLKNLKNKGIKNYMKVMSRDKSLQAQIETHFEKIYSIRITEPNLDQLIIIKSFNECQRTTEILKLIKCQPNPKLFFQTFLELNVTNVTSILASDSSCMETLLADKFSSYFSIDYPIVFKLGIPQKLCQQTCLQSGGIKQVSAIDIALQHDQVQSIGKLIDYIVKYQNTYVSSFLFEKNLGRLIDIGVNMYQLFQSEVFLMQFDYDHWPGVHHCDTEAVRPYNGSIFALRHHYETVFPELDFGKIQNETTSTKRFKIGYRLNLLPQYFFGHIQSGDDDGNLWDELKDDAPNITGDIDEPGHFKIDYFTIDSIKQLIDFKWDKGTQSQILFNFSLHLLYLIVVTDYIIEVYQREQHAGEQTNSEAYQNQLRIDTEEYTIIMAVLLFYPLVYEAIQCLKAGLVSYFCDIYNYVDLLSIISGSLHIWIANRDGPINFQARITFIVAFFAAVLKFFRLMRVFKDFAPVVVILQQSIFDLRFFLLILALISFIFGLACAVMGLDNRNIPGDLNNLYKDLSIQEAKNAFMPNPEFVQIHSIMSYFLEIFNIAAGNFAIVNSVKFLPETAQRFFWIIFIFAVFAILVVFINFVVAKAMASHAQATQQLEAVMNKERVDMIDEVHALSSKRFATPDMNPRYLVERRIES